MIAQWEKRARIDNFVIKIILSAFRDPIPMARKQKFLGSALNDSPRSPSDGRVIADTVNSLAPILSLMALLR